MQAVGSPAVGAPAADRAREQRGHVGPLLAVAIVIVVSGVVDLWWLHRFRAGFPLDINEGQYMGFSLALKDGLAHGGPAGLWHAWAAQRQFGPLLPLVSVPVFAVAGESPDVGFAAQLVFLAVLIISAYGLGARLTSRAGGVLVAVLVAATPTIIDFTRSYEFPVTAAAILTACTYALLASEGLRQRGPMIAWGVLLGLLPLARTMTIAFVPAQVLLAGWLVLVRPDARRERVVNAALGVLVAVLVAATWFVKAWHDQLHYLTSFGYGRQSHQFSVAGSRATVGYWTRELVASVREDLYLPLAALVVICLVLGLVAAVVRRRSAGAAEGVVVRFRAWAQADVFVVLVVVLEGYLAVTSSRNEGVGFRVPLLPGVLALAVYALWRLPWPAIRRGLVVLLLATCAFNVLMKADLTRALSGTADAHVPGFGATPIVDGTGWIQSFVLGAGEAAHGPATEPLGRAQRGWMPAYRQLADDTLRLAGGGRAGPVVELTTDEPLLNAYDLSFAARLDRHRDLSANVLPSPADHGIAPFSALLGRLRISIGVNTLITVNQPGVSYFATAAGTAVSQGLFRRAAASLGFVCRAAVALPDGRKAYVSVRSAGGAPVAPSPRCAPVVQRTEPADGATRVPTGARIVVEFDQAVNPSTAAAALVLRSGDGRRVPGTTEPFGGQAVVFTPSRPLAASGRFTATVSRSATGVSGMSLRRVARWSFVTR